VLSAKPLTYFVAEEASKYGRLIVPILSQRFKQSEQSTV
jgi:hypothetical protein